MKKLFRLVLCSGLLLVISNQGVSQKTTTKATKTTTKNKDVPPPPPKKDPPGVKMQKVDTTDLPPDVEELQDTKIDVLSPPRIMKDEEVRRYPGKNPDTIPPPQDELTMELRKMLELTGALNLGLQFAKGMQDMQAGQNILPQEFFDRLFKEITTGNGRRWFENAIIKVYRKHLTLQDVKDLNAFYTTPTGKKYLSLLPVFLEESKQAGASIGEYLGIKIYEQLVEEGKLK